jgi:alpha-beta hydrolase superfamily lysophospholipase
MTEGTLERSGLYWRSWTDDQPATGVVVLVHGLHEHSGRYAHVAERLLRSGYRTYAVDHAGHGHSPGSRGNIGTMAATVAGVHEVAQLAQSENPDRPTFVYGHSMGGLIALQYLTGDAVSLHGAVLSAPAVDLSAASGLQVAAAGVLSRFVPDLGVVQLDATAVSRDAEVVARYRSDPLNRMGKVRARTGAELLQTVRALQPRVEALRLPLYLLHGTADRLVPIAATDWIEQHAGSPDLTVRRWEGLFHEAHNEPERERVLDEIVTWLDAHRAA